MDKSVNYAYDVLTYLSKKRDKIYKWIDEHPDPTNERCVQWARWAELDETIILLRGALSGEDMSDCFNLDKDEEEDFDDSISYEELEG